MISHDGYMHLIVQSRTSFRGVGAIMHYALCPNRGCGLFLIGWSVTLGR